MLHQAPAHHLSSPGTWVCRVDLSISAACYYFSMFYSLYLFYYVQFISLSLVYASIVWLGVGRVGSGSKLFGQYKLLVVVFQVLLGLHCPSQAESI